KLGADFVGGAAAVPNAKFGQHAGCAFRGRDAADIQIIEGIFQRLAFRIVEFAIDVNLESSFVVARDAHVCPQLRRHLALRDYSVAVLWPAINAKAAVEEIEIRSAGPAKDAILIGDVRVETKPAFDGERAGKRE